MIRYFNTLSKAAYTVFLAFILRQLLGVKQSHPNVKCNIEKTKKKKKKKPKKKKKKKTTKNKKTTTKKQNNNTFYIQSQQTQPRSCTNKVFSYIALYLSNTRYVGALKPVSAISFCFSVYYSASVFSASVLYHLAVFLSISKTVDLMPLHTFNTDNSKVGICIKTTFA